MVSNLAIAQLNREKIVPLSPFAPENLVPRDNFDRPFPQPVVRLDLMLTRVGEVLARFQQSAGCFLIQNTTSYNG